MTWELRSARWLAAEVQERVICPGDTVIDATMGNGHDTLRLARLVGPSGKVVGFDIQPAAVRNTEARLREEGLAERCVLHCAGHEQMNEYVREPVRCVVFNLGWLPGGDKRLTTQWETTRQAVSSALNLLLPMGVCTLCVYPGHPEGDRERRELVQYLSALRPQAYNVLHQCFLNAGPDAPECLVIQRQRQ